MTTTSRWTVDDDDSPWTCGDMHIAAKAGEPMGDVEIMFDIRDAEGNVVARVPWDVFASEDEQRAIRRRADLLAAAPQLLEACEAALRHVKEDAMEYSEGDHGDRVYIADQLRAAIAAARGEEGTR